MPSQFLAKLAIWSEGLTFLHPSVIFLLETLESLNWTFQHLLFIKVRVNIFL